MAEEFCLSSGTDVPKIGSRKKKDELAHTAKRFLSSVKCHHYNRDSGRRHQLPFKD